MQEKIGVVKKKEELSSEMQKAIDEAVVNAMKGVASAAGINPAFVEIQEKTLQTLKDISERSVPADSKAALEQQTKDYESPYIDVGDKVGVLTVSTSDLQRMDGWPGKINQPLPGQYTKQGLEKRLSVPVEIVYVPSLGSKYSFAIVDREEYEKIVAQRHGVGGIPVSTMVASMGARAGEE